MKKLSALLAAVACLLVALTGVVAAQDEGVPPTEFVVHRVDARSNPVEVTLISNDYGAGEVSVKENGDDRAAQAALSTAESEIVFVVDTSQRLRRGDALALFTTELAGEIRALPRGTSVAVVEAGRSAIVRADMTSDLQSAAAAVEDLGFSEGGKLYNAIDRGVSLLSDPVVFGEPDKIQTLVVFAGGADVGSEVEVGVAQAGLIRRGAQMVAIQFNGGDSPIGEVVRRTGGLSFASPSVAELSSAIVGAVDASSQRLIVRYEGTIEVTERGDATLTYGSSQTSYSYGGGDYTARAVALAPSTLVENTSMFSFFQTQTGLYVTLLFAFLGIGLAIFGVGTIFAGGETSLEGLISRYSGGGDSELNDEETNIVQTALVQRAVELSESFAEDRGFLLKVEEMLERAKLPLRPGEAMSFYAGGVVLSMVIGFFLLGGPLGAVILGFVAAVGAIGVVRFMARRRMKKFEKQLPDTLQLLAGTLRAGYSLPQGLDAVSTEIADPMGYELRRALTETQLGREIEDALAGIAERLDSEDFAWAVMAIGIQREVGGNLSEVLLTVSDTMIQRERLHREVNALTAEGRVSAGILSMLPPGLGFVMWVMNPEYLGVLFSRRIGWILLSLAVVAGLVGLAWMKKVVTIDV